MGIWKESVIPTLWVQESPNIYNEMLTSLEV